MTTLSKEHLYHALRDSGLFAFFAANLEHLLDISSLDRQLHLFAEAQHFSDRQSTCIPGGIADTDYGHRYYLPDDPCMIVTFHYGYYSLLPARLAVQGIPICVLAAADVLQEQQPYYTRLFAGMTDVQLAFVAAEDCRVFYTLRHYLDQGYYILCYADGGKGSQPIQRARHTAVMDFLQARIRVRTGFAHMAYLLRCPIWAVWDARVSSTESTCYQKQYVPAIAKSRSEFVDYVVTDIFRAFARQVQKWPAVWESLFYLHHYLVMDRCPKDSPLSARVIPFRQNSRCFVLDKAAYQCYPVAEEKFDRLLSAFCAL